MSLGHFSDIMIKRDNLWQHNKVLTWMTQSEHDYAAKVRERTLVSSLPELRTAAERLESLITDTKQYTGSTRQIICAITPFILGRTIFLTL